MMFEGDMNFNPRTHRGVRREKKDITISSY